MGRRGSNRGCQKRFVVTGLWKFPQSCPQHVVRVCLHAPKESSGVGAGCRNYFVCCACSRRPRSCETAAGRPLLLSRDRERALDQRQQLPLHWRGLHRAKQKFPGADAAKTNSSSPSPQGAAPACAGLASLGETEKPTVPEPWVSVTASFLPFCLQENPQAAFLLRSQASRQTPLQAHYPPAHPGSAAAPAHER